MYNHSEALQWYDATLLFPFHPLDLEGDPEEADPERLSVPWESAVTSHRVQQRACNELFHRLSHETLSSDRDACASCAALRTSLRRGDQMYTVADARAHRDAKRIGEKEVAGKRSLGMQHQPSAQHARGGVGNRHRFLPNTCGEAEALGSDDALGKSNSDWLDSDGSGYATEDSIGDAALPMSAASRALVSDGARPEARRDRATVPQHSQRLRDFFMSLPPQTGLRVEPVLCPFHTHSDNLAHVAVSAEVFAVVSATTPQVLYVFDQLNNLPISSFVLGGTTYASARGAGTTGGAEDCNASDASTPFCAAARQRSETAPSSLPHVGNAGLRPEVWYVPCTIGVEDAVSQLWMDPTGHYCVVVFTSGKCVYYWIPRRPSVTSGLWRFADDVTKAQYATGDNVVALEVDDNNDGGEGALLGGNGKHRQQRHREWRAAAHSWRRWSHPQPSDEEGVSPEKAKQESTPSAAVGKGEDAQRSAAYRPRGFSLTVHTLVPRAPNLEFVLSSVGWCHYTSPAAAQAATKAASSDARPPPTHPRGFCCTGDEVKDGVEPASGRLRAPPTPVADALLGSQQGGLLLACILTPTGAEQTRIVFAFPSPLSRHPIDSIAAFCATDVEPLGGSDGSVVDKAASPQGDTGGGRGGKARREGGPSEVSPSPFPRYTHTPHFISADDEGRSQADGPDVGAAPLKQLHRQPSCWPCRWVVLVCVRNHLYVFQTALPRISRAPDVAPLQVADPAVSGEANRTDLLHLSGVKLRSFGVGTGDEKAVPHLSGKIEDAFLSYGPRRSAVSEAAPNFSDLVCGLKAGECAPSLTNCLVIEEDALTRWSADIGDKPTYAHAPSSIPDEKWDPRETPGSDSISSVSAVPRHAVPPQMPVISTSFGPLCDEGNGRTTGGGTQHLPPPVHPEPVAACMAAAPFLECNRTRATLHVALLEQRCSGATRAGVGSEAAATAAVCPPAFFWQYGDVLVQGIVFCGAAGLEVGSKVRALLNGTLPGDASPIVAGTVNGHQPRDSSRVGSDLRAPVSEGDLRGLLDDALHQTRNLNSWVQDGVNADCCGTSVKVAGTTRATVADNESEPARRTTSAMANTSEAVPSGVSPLPPRISSTASEELLPIGVLSVVNVNSCLRSLHDLLRTGETVGDGAAVAGSGEGHPLSFTSCAIPTASLDADVSAAALGVSLSDGGPGVIDDGRADSFTNGEGARFAPLHHPLFQFPWDARLVVAKRHALGGDAVGTSHCGLQQGPYSGQVPCCYPPRGEGARRGAPESVAIALLDDGLARGDIDANTLRRLRAVAAAAEEGSDYVFHAPIHGALRSSALLFTDAMLESTGAPRTQTRTTEPPASHTHPYSTRVRRMVAGASMASPRGTVHHEESSCLRPSPKRGGNGDDFASRGTDTVGTAAPPYGVHLPPAGDTLVSIAASYSHLVFTTTEGVYVLAHAAVVPLEEAALSWRRALVYHATTTERTGVGKTSPAMSSTGARHLPTPRFRVLSDAAAPNMFYLASRVQMVRLHTASVSTSTPGRKQFVLQLLQWATRVERRRGCLQQRFTPSIQRGCRTEPAALKRTRPFMPQSPLLPLSSSFSMLGNGRGMRTEDSSGGSMPLFADELLSHYACDSSVEARSSGGLDVVTVPSTLTYEARLREYLCVRRDDDLPSHRNNMNEGGVAAGRRCAQPGIADNTPLEATRSWRSSHYASPTIATMSKSRPNAAVMNREGSVGDAADASAVGGDAHVFNANSPRTRQTLHRTFLENSFSFDDGGSTVDAAALSTSFHFLPRHHRARRAAKLGFPGKSSLDAACFLRDPSPSSVVPLRTNVITPIGPVSGLAVSPPGTPAVSVGLHSDGLSHQFRSGRSRIEGKQVGCDGTRPLSPQGPLSPGGASENPASPDTVSDMASRCPGKSAGESLPRTLHHAEVRHFRRVETQGQGAHSSGDGGVDGIGLTVSPQDRDVMEFLRANPLLHLMLQRIGVSTALCGGVREARATDARTPSLPLLNCRVSTPRTTPLWRTPQRSSFRNTRAVNIPGFGALPGSVGLTPLSTTSSAAVACLLLHLPIGTSFYCADHLYEMALDACLCGRAVPSASVAAAATSPQRTMTCADVELLGLVRHAYGSYLLRSHRYLEAAVQLAKTPPGGSCSFATTLIELIRVFRETDSLEPLLLYLRLRLRSLELSPQGLGGHSLAVSVLTTWLLSVEIEQCSASRADVQPRCATSADLVTSDEDEDRARHRRLRGESAAGDYAEALRAAHRRRVGDPAGASSSSPPLEYTRVSWIRQRYSLHDPEALLEDTLLRYGRFVEWSALSTTLTRLASAQEAVLTAELQGVPESSIESLVWRKQDFFAGLTRLEALLVDPTAQTPETRAQLQALLSRNKGTPRPLLSRQSRPSAPNSTPVVKLQPATYGAMRMMSAFTSIPNATLDAVGSAIAVATTDSVGYTPLLRDCSHVPSVLAILYGHLSGIFLRCYPTRFVQNGLLVLRRQWPNVDVSLHMLLPALLSYNLVNNESEFEASENASVVLQALAMTQCTQQQTKTGCVADGIGARHDCRSAQAAHNLSRRHRTVPLDTVTVAAEAEDVKGEGEDRAVTEAVASTLAPGTSPRVSTNGNEVSGTKRHGTSALPAAAHTSRDTSPAAPPTLLTGSADMKCLPSEDVEVALPPLLDHASSHDASSNSHTTSDACRQHSLTGAGAPTGASRVVASSGKYFDDSDPGEISEAQAAGPTSTRHLQRIPSVSTPTHPITLPLPTPLPTSSHVNTIASANPPEHAACLSLSFPQSTCLTPNARGVQVQSTVTETLGVSPEEVLGEQHLAPLATGKPVASSLTPSISLAFGKAEEAGEWRGGGAKDEEVEAEGFSVGSQHESFLRRGTSKSEASSGSGEVVDAAHSPFSSPHEPPLRCGRLRSRLLVPAITTAVVEAVTTRENPAQTWEERRAELERLRQPVAANAVLTYLAPLVDPTHHGGGGGGLNAEADDAIFFTYANALLHGGDAKNFDRFIEAFAMQHVAAMKLRQVNLATTTTTAGALSFSTAPRSPPTAAALPRLLFLFRLCSRHQRWVGCAWLYYALGCFQPAVQLALKCGTPDGGVDFAVKLLGLLRERDAQREGAALAQEERVGSTAGASASAAASSTGLDASIFYGTEEDHLRQQAKRWSREELWMLVARHLIGGGGVRGTRCGAQMALQLSAQHGGDTFNITDVLPELPDSLFMTDIQEQVQASVQELTRQMVSLKTHTAALGREMRVRHRELRAVAHASLPLQVTDRCVVCRQRALTRPFTLYPRCRHLIHVSCYHRARRTMEQQEASEEIPRPVAGAAAPPTIMSEPSAAMECLLCARRCLHHMLDAPLSVSLIGDDAGGTEGYAVLR